jgi:uncharacterized protein (DUF2249 family)
MTRPAQFKRFDVRSLIQNGVEPFPEILERVSRLKSNEGLLVIAPFLPSPLIEKLEGMGFLSKIERNGIDWMVSFWRESP